MQFLGPELDKRFHLVPHPGELQMHSHACQHLLFLERACNVIDATGLEGFDFFIDVFEGADENDGDVMDGGVGFEFSAEFKPIYIRHSDIQQDKIRACVFRCAQCHMGVEGRAGVMPFFLQDLNEQFQIFRTIIYNQNRCLTIRCGVGVLGLIRHLSSHSIDNVPNRHQRGNYRGEAFVSHWISLVVCPISCISLIFIPAQAPIALWARGYDLLPT